MKTQASPPGIRLQKWLAEAGLCSRRAAEVLIRQGRVRVNGKTVTELGTRARLTDHILVDGKPLAPRPAPVHVVLHKPAGVVTTMHDPEGRATVRDLVPRDLPRLYPVGRLDVQSTGLVLLTNDGDLALRLMHPRHHVARTYRVKVSGAPSERALARMRRGIRLTDGRSAPAEVAVERSLPTKTWLRLTVWEGRTHLVRRLCDAIGHRAEKLQRVTIGPLSLGTLAPGASRPVTASELRALRLAAGLDRATPSGLRRRSVRRSAP